jgi:Na+/pantothenate symporter
MEKEIEIEGHKVFLKGKKDSWRVIHPYKVDGKIVWKNLLANGSWWNWVIIAFLVFVILGAFNEYANNLKVTSACLRALPDYINLDFYIQNPLLNSTTFFPLI